MFASRTALAAALLVLVGHASECLAQISYERARQLMVEQVILGGGIKNPRVVQAMRDTPRHEFVAPQYRSQAYYDMALPIGESQTISSPYIVAFMTQAIDPQPTDRVLEIGTGSGYQAAVLSPLVAEVYSIEIVEALGRRAEQALTQLGYKNVHVRVGDGFQGWPEHAPFDKIIVTCSPERVPQPLVEQLREGGRMVIPVGERYQQTLYLMRKTDGKLVSEALQPTLFVPMTGTAEADRQVKPDPLRPEIVNGDFEQPALDNGYIPGWYYQRLVSLRTDGAPEGEQYVEFQNDVLGRPAYMLQGLPIQGDQITRMRISTLVKLKGVRDAGRPNEYATIAITFYDANRREVGLANIGHLRGTHDWREIEQSVRVPPEAREMLVRIGLFGATGTAAFDAVRLHVESR